jgi:hypothetical protein
MNKVISIDPGANGGIAVFEDGELTGLLLIPKVKDKIDYRFLEQTLTKLIDKNTTIVLEEVHSIYGASAKSNHAFGHINGVLLGIILCTRQPFVFVQPKEWQKYVWSNQDKVYKPGKAKQTVDTKATSLLAAKRLFPQVDFTKVGRSVKPHDGLIDAALIGKWYLNGNR